MKAILVLIFGLMLWGKANAQSKKVKPPREGDTVLYAMKNSGELVLNKDSADYFVFNLPADPKTGLYQIVEIYRDGKPKLITYSKKRSFIVFREGPCTTFFPNGKHKTIENYEDGYPVGELTEYYPNGQVYAVKKYTDEKDLADRKLLLIACHDSTGKILAENGIGKWLVFDTDFKKLYQEGAVSDGIRDGTWTMVIDDKKFSFVYTKGIITTPIDYDFKDKIFEQSNVAPGFNGGTNAFYIFLMKGVHYPAVDRENNVQGKVFISFIVEKDGKLTDFKIVKAPSKTLAAEALRSLQLSPAWTPGNIGGVPVRIRFTVPINFTLASDN